MATYNRIGGNYAEFRRPEARIAARIADALGDSRSVLNIGAGSGSYEPVDRDVTALEPSDTMIRQRPTNAAPCVQGVAEALPFADCAFDAAMGVLTLHHWSDPARGLAEMRRVARRRAVLLTWVPDSPAFWLTRDYFPEILAQDLAIFPDSHALEALMERCIGPCRIEPMPIPHDCSDGFLCAYWRRPEAYLDPERRRAISSFATFDPAPGLERLRADLDSGAWSKRNAELLGMDALDVGYRIISCEISQT